MSEAHVQAIIVRAIKTFLQGFVASLVAALAIYNGNADTAAVRALIVGAIAAGVSALMNSFIKPTEAK